MKPLHTDKILHLTPEDSKLFVEMTECNESKCTENTEPNETMRKAAEKYRATVNERYENISARIAEKCDKNWLCEKCTSEDAILEECVKLCNENDEWTQLTLANMWEEDEVDYTL